MRRIVIGFAGATLCTLAVTGSRPAAADILVNISKASQRMSVLVDGSAVYNWKVSTGAQHYTTPSGVYKPEWLARKWRSKKYGNAPMPHSIFFYEGYAMHGTTEIARLGKIASHGCVRLHPDNAATLFELVQKHMANTRVVVSDDVIDAPGEAPKKRPNQFVADNGKRAEAMPASGLMLEIVALAPEDAAMPENPVTADPFIAVTARAKPARTEKIARAHSVGGGGFHW
jgi:hypothetical protein